MNGFRCFKNVKSKQSAQQVEQFLLARLVVCAAAALPAAAAGAAAVPTAAHMYGQQKLL